MTIFKFVLSILTVFLFSSPGHAGAIKKTDWFLGKDRRAIVLMMKDKLLLEIECKGNGHPGLHIARDSFRVTYSDNPNDIKYYWAIGSQYGRVRELAKKNGYKLVKVNRFVRKSGLVIRCAVWHKK